MKNKQQKKPCLLRSFFKYVNTWYSVRLCNYTQVVSRPLHFQTLADGNKNVRSAIMLYLQFNFKRTLHQKLRLPRQLEVPQNGGLNTF